MVFLKTDRDTYLELPVPSCFSIGRGSNCDIKPDSKSVSKRHGQLTIERNAKTGKAEAWLEDFNSTFGTYVGEDPSALEKITEKTRLFFGFYIRFGHAPNYFQYLEHKEDDIEDDTTQANTVTERPRDSRSIPAPVVIPPARVKTESVRDPPPQPIPSPKHQMTDEELAIHLQFGQGDGTSPPRSRTKDLIQQYEAKSRPTSSSPSFNLGGNSSKKNSSPTDSTKNNEQPSGFGNETTSFRDMAPQGSFLVNSEMKLNHPAESYSDLLWEESQTAQPTPTVCLPPGKTPNNINTSDYGGFAYDLDEKPGADEVGWLAPGAEIMRAGTTSTVASPRPAASAAPTPRSTASTAAGGTFAAPAGASASASTSAATSPRSGGTIAAPPAGSMGSPRASAALSAATAAAAAGTTASSPRGQYRPAPGDYDPMQIVLLREQAILQARRAFRQQRAATLPEAGVQYNTYRAVARQWRKASLSLDSVAGGFCISVVLPFLDRVKVKPAGKENHKVRIDARRWVDANDAYATDADSEFLAEFKLRGLTSEIHAEDLSHEYDEVTGLLCVFVNRLRLKNDELLVKKRSVPVLAKPEYVKAKSPKDAQTKASREPLTVRSLFSWIPGVGLSKEEEQKSHEEAAKTYRKVLSRKTSMLQEAGMSGDGGGAAAGAPAAGPVAMVPVQRRPVSAPAAPAAQHCPALTAEEEALLRKAQPTAPSEVIHI